MSDVLHMQPVPMLLDRVRSELLADFSPSRPMRVSRAPGRLDLMGGIADYTGSMVLETTLDRAVAIVLQSRDDAQLQLFSFNLFDDHQPFTFRMPLAALGCTPLELLHREFAGQGRKWAAYMAGCLWLLHEKKLIDLCDPALRGCNLAVYSTVPAGAGVSSSAALEVATMMNFIDHFNLRDKVEPFQLAEMCQQVENRVVGAPCGIMDQVSSCLGRAGSLLRLVCQPHELLPDLKLPPGTRILGINSQVRHSVGGGQYGKTRCAAFMGHRMILQQMKQMGEKVGRELLRDPMNGYLANLDPEDYKQIFRQHLPERITGREFMASHGATIDKATTVAEAETYFVVQATDHHVLEARRVRRFVEFLEQAANATGTARKLLLDKAGHLMYASHLSYTNDAMLGADECDLLVSLVRQRENAGLYGAKITGGGSGGTVAILAEESPTVDAALLEIMSAYETQTGRKPESFVGTSSGAWHAGTALVSPN